MILLDTNVISEVMRPKPSHQVVGWLRQHHTVGLALSAITIAEIGYGLAILPQGQCKQLLQQKFEQLLVEGFSGKILHFDEVSARHYADIMAQRRAIGHPMSMADGQIAAIARAHQIAVATRNTDDFEQTGIEVINPFL